MTLTATTVKDPYDGDDSTTSFAITFIFWNDSDIKAIKTDSSGTESTLVLNTHYTLSGGDGSTGTLTTTTGNTFATGEKLTVKSNRPDTQLTALSTGGALPSSDIERMVDQNTRLIQQFAEEIARTLTFAESSTDTGSTFPDHTGNTDKLIVVNSTGTGFTAATLASIDSSAVTTPVSFANGGTATDLSSGLTALDIIRVASGGSTMEGRNLSETVGDLFIKGGDIVSADPLVIDVDGHYFDVTGTTTFDEQTVAAGRLYILQFDGALTMTDDADHDLGGADIVTHTGCRGLFYATAANTVQLIAWIFEGDQRRVDSTGAATNAVQPAFRATTASLSNVTGDATIYTVVFATEVFDQNADFDGTSTFTAPKTGRYLLVATVKYTGVTAGTADSLSLELVTSNDIYTITKIGTNLMLTGDSVHVSAVADMDLSDTALIRFTISGDAKVADIAAGEAHFSGCLLT